MRLYYYTYISIIVIIIIIWIIYQNSNKKCSKTPLKTMKYSTYTVIPFDGSHAYDSLDMYSIHLIPPYKRCYNASIIAQDNNDLPSLYYTNKSKLIMITRCNKDYNNVLLSDFMLSSINFPSMTVNTTPKLFMIHGINNNNNNIKSSPEDPRIISLKKSNKILISYTRIITNSLLHNKDMQEQNKICEIKMSVFDKDFNILEKNIQLKNINNTKKWEKNWTFYENKKGDLYCIYSINPFIVYHVNTSTWECTKLHEYNWFDNKHEYRGNTPAVEVDNKLYMIIHHKDSKSIYNNYIFVLNKDTFKPIQISRVRILPDQNKWNQLVFPISMLYNKKTNNFLISMGIDDVYTGLVEYPKPLIDSILIPINF